MNWGMKAPKNSSAFGFDQMTMKPCITNDPIGRARVPAVPSVPSERHILIPSQIR